MTDMTRKRLKTLEAIILGIECKDPEKLHWGDPAAKVVFKEIFGRIPNKHEADVMKHALKFTIKEELPKVSKELLSLMFGEKAYDNKTVVDLPMRDEDGGMDLYERLDSILYMVEMNFDKRIKI